MKRTNRQSAALVLTGLMLLFGVMFFSNAKLAAKPDYGRAEKLNTQIYVNPQEARELLNEPASKYAEK